MRSHALWLLCTLAPLGCAKSPRGASVAPVSFAQSPSLSERVLSEDTRWRSTSGATMTAPKGWHLLERGGFAKLTSGDGEVTLAVAENRERSAAGATAHAWSALDAKFSRKEKRTTSPPVRGGWDEVVQTEYETTTDEARTVIAVARRKGDRWYVVLLDGKNRAIDRLAAQVMTSVASLRAPGLEEESLSRKKMRVLDDARLDQFFSFIEEARREAHVVGAAVAVVHGGEAAFRGFGVRELGKEEGVTPDTLFMIGSTTKSLTSLMMAALVDAKKFSWDSKVTALMPDFALGDRDATRALSMKHTVCACTGLPRQDMEFLFEYRAVTPRMRLLGMRTMKPTTGFGEIFQYSNSMVSAGGYVAAHTVHPEEELGAAYDKEMRTRVFQPLGMASTTFNFEGVRKQEHAVPHAESLDLDVRALPLSDEEGVVPIRPAGGAWSSVRDMARYVALELAKGRGPSGNRVVSEENLLRRREPQVKITDDMSYGLGLFVEQDHGVTTVHHGGNNMGFTSDMFFLPDHNAGVVLLANTGNANAFRKAVRRRFLELAFDAKEEARENLAFSTKKSEERSKEERAKIDRTPHVKGVAGAIGTYWNEHLGEVVVRMEQGRPVLDAGEWKSAFSTKREGEGAVTVVLVDPPWAGLEFLVGKGTLTLTAGQVTYLFVRR